MPNRIFKFSDSVFRESDSLDALKIETEDFTPNFLVSGDFNGDSLIDLFFTSLDWKVQGANGEKTPAWLLLQNSAGDWERADINGLDNEAVAQWPSRNVVADLNDDGVDEILIVETGPHKLGANEEWGGYNKLIGFNEFRNIISDQSDELPELKLYSHWISVGDINTDGLLDLVVNDRTNMGTRLWQASPSGNFIDVADFNSIFGSYETISSSGNLYQAPEKHLSSLIFDLDLDGYMDVVVGQDHRGSGSRVYWNKSGELKEDLFFTLPSGNYQSIYGAVTISSVNLNNDNYPDLVISNVSKDYKDNRLQFLINNGDRTFTDETFDYLESNHLIAQEISLLKEKNPGTPWVIAFQVLDIDGDGLDEIFLKADGLGYGFLDSSPSEKKLNQLFIRDTSSAELTDLDADGDLDIVLARTKTFQGSDVSVQLLENITRDSTEIIGTSDIDVLFTGNFRKVTKIDTGVYEVDDYRIRDIERLISPDIRLAFDLEGATGDVIKILTAVIGKHSALNPEYIGLGIQFLDNAYSVEEIFSLALDTVGADTAEKKISLLWKNLFGSPPNESTLNQYSEALRSGLISSGEFTTGVLDAVSELNLIDFVGLSSTGVEFKDSPL